MINLFYLNIYPESELPLFFRRLLKFASSVTTSTKPRSTFPGWHLSRRSKLTWLSGKAEHLLTSSKQVSPSHSDDSSSSSPLNQWPRGGSGHCSWAQKRIRDGGGPLQMLCLWPFADWQAEPSQIHCCQKVIILSQLCCQEVIFHSLIDTREVAMATFSQSAWCLIIYYVLIEYWSIGWCD